jgi:hypothetical protein
MIGIRASLETLSLDGRPTFYVLHYRGNVERRRYLDHAFSIAGLQQTYILDFDREEFDLGSFYRPDEKLFIEMIKPIWPLLLGYVVGLERGDIAQWKDCVAEIKRSGLTLDQALSLNPWLRPSLLTPASVSIFLKHQEAWRRLAAGDAPFAILAEDDIVFRQRSGEYLSRLLQILPSDFDFIDIAGGCNLFPRAANECVNDFFFRIDPPRDRTACCAIVSRKFARKLVDLKLPICLPIDWTLTYAFARTKAHVYWVEPTPFGHGSMMGIYASHAQS